MVSISFIASSYNICEHIRTDTTSYITKGHWKYIEGNSAQNSILNRNPLNFKPVTFLQVNEISLSSLQLITRAININVLC